MKESDKDKVKQKEINDLCFFRPLLPGFSKKMTLPRDLDERLNMYESRKTATLVSHTDKTRVWHVDFHKEEKQMFIEGEGWENFVQAHDLRDFYMLVFRYRGNMVFTFRVFDKMTYCVSQKGAKEKVILIDDEDENTNIIQRPTKSSCRKRKAKDLTHFSHISLKRMATRSMDQVAGEREKKIARKMSFEASSKACNQVAGEREKKVARKVSFEATIKACNLNTRRYGMRIPSEFIKSCGLQLENGELVLCDPEDRKWLVSLSKGRGSTTIFISKGWSKFARGNMLKEGDRCIFDLAASSQRTNKFLNVKILKCSGTQHVDQADQMENLSFRDLSTRPPTLRPLSTGPVLRPTKSPEDQNTSTKFAKELQFEATISASNLTSYGLYIPKEFEKISGLNKLSEVVLIDPSGQRWPVMLHHRQKNAKETHMGRGWKNFARSNNLKEGHCCIFKLVSEGKGNLLQVQVLRRKQVREAQVLERRQKKTGRLLHFEATISSSSIRKHDLYIRRFKDSRILEELGEVILIDPVGRRWPVSIVHRIRQCGNTDSYMRKGWKKFSCGNHLQECDKCIFDELDGYPNVLQVQILKKSKECK